MTDGEINLAVAIKLGWVKNEMGWQSPLQQRQYPAWSDFEPPEYCYEMSVAWEIVSKITKDGEGRIAVELYSTNRTHICTIKKWEHSEMLIAQEKADSAPMAICLAFLKIP